MSFYSIQEPIVICTDKGFNKSFGDRFTHYVTTVSPNIFS